MKNTLFILSIVLTLQARADFFCHEEPIQQQGDNYAVCGIGENPNEAEARNLALLMAYAEFNTSCATNAKCVNETHSSENLRTECTRNSQGFHCVRMIKVSTIPTDPRLIGAYAPGYGAFRIGGQ